MDTATRPQYTEALKVAFRPNSTMAKQQPPSSKGISRGGEPPSRNQLCPCGSGKKYKRCCALKTGGIAQRSKSILILIGGITLAVLLGYGVTQMGPGDSSVRSNTTTFGGLQGTGYYTEADLGEVDFSVLTEAQKKKVLDDINRALCTCGCNLTLAQCVATDSTCPLRISNIERIRSLIQQESG